MNYEGVIIAESLKAPSITQWQRPHQMTPVHPHRICTRSPGHLEGARLCCSCKLQLPP